MENTFFIPLSGYHLCFDLPSVISDCFPLCNIHFFSQIKCLFYKKYTDDPNSKEQHIQFADRIWHINFHLSKSTDETHTHCQNPVMIPAGILIKDNILPVPAFQESDTVTVCNPSEHISQHTPHRLSFPGNLRYTKLRCG